MDHRLYVGSLLGVSLALAVAGCGGSAPSTPPATPPNADSAAAPLPAAAPSPPGEAPKAATTNEAPNGADAAKPEPKAPPDPNATREVTYVVVPEGLKISVAGVKFLASATATPAGGGFGVKVNLSAAADDGKSHLLSKPNAGPMAFAGSVTRKGKADPEHFGDERAGDGQEPIDSDQPLKVSRTWPSKGVRALGIGDTLDLQVALWGLGPDADSLRPVKQFFHVRVAFTKGKPKAIVEPPASASGK
jgi:hypothetical protein